MNRHHSRQALSKWPLAGLAIALASAICVPADAGERLYWIDAVEARLPPSSDLIAQGRTVYENRCVLCHGKNGLGNGAAADYLPTRPRDFSSGQFKFLTTLDFPTDEDLFRSITVGFPAYGMPEFAYLSGVERWGLVYYVKELGRAGFRDAMEAELIEERLGISADELTSELKAQNQDILSEIQAESRKIASYRFEASEGISASRGVVSRASTFQAWKEAYFRLGCNKCHGDAGHADGLSAGSLLDNDGRTTKPRDFSSTRWYFKAGERAEDIVRVLIAGMPGTPMPSFDLGPESQRDLWNTAHYVRSLANLEKQNVKEAQE